MRFLLLLLAAPIFSCAQQFTKADSLLGGIGPHRVWWDVQRYDITVKPDYATKTLAGKSTITYTVVADKPSDYLQLDLQQPLELDSIYYNGKMHINYPSKPYYREGGQFFISLPKAAKGSTNTLTIVYHGKPKEAKRAPWDGGWVWAKDKQGRPWMTAAVEGEGASSWFPCKDSWADEPDKGMSLTVMVPNHLTAVANGRLKSKQLIDSLAAFTWEVSNPINAYNIIPSIGYYTAWSDTLQGEKGKLDLTYWVLDYELEKAKKQFEQVKPTIRAFEYWFGPYPFYEDGYQLVQAPHLGMEHQSAVAYGNGFQNGYRGSDLSGSGWGLKWDFIIVHESGHEWFGNNITAKDRADMWIQEGFTNYSEPLFTEYYYGKEAGNAYVQGLRRNIQNDKPVIGIYGVANEGSGDMYYKGANLIHTIRQIINDDEKFRSILRGLNKDFYHQTVTSKQVENYISTKSGIDFSKVFDQYLRSIEIPVLEFRTSKNETQARWTNTVGGFSMPIRLTNSTWIKPTTIWQTIKISKETQLAVDPNFYISTKRL